MKKFLLIFCLFLGVGMVSYSQDNDGGGRIQALKIAFLTKKLNLSPEEAQRFWPIYNKYEDEIRKAKLDNRTDELKREEKILDVRKKFNGEFLKALSSEKVNSFFKIEKEFNNYLQKEIMERRQQRIERNRLRQQ